MFNIFNKPHAKDELAESDRSLRGKAESLGKILGLKELPADGQTLAQHVGPIIGGYRTLLNTYCIKTGGKESAVAALRQKAAAEKEAHLNARLTKLQHKEQTMLLDREELPLAKASAKGSLWIYAVTACVGIFEGIISRKAGSIFDAGSGNNITQLIVLVVLTGLFIALPHGIVWTYHNTKHSRYRFIIWGGMAAVILAGFYGLACMRSRYVAMLSMSSLDAAPASNTLPLSPIYFLLLQCFLLLVSIMVASLLPSPEDKQRSRDIEELDRLIADTQGEIRRIEDQLGGGISERALRDEMSKADSEASAEAMREKIREMYEESIGAFVTSNVRWRHTPAPECMNQIPEL